MRSARDTPEIGPRSRDEIGASWARVGRAHAPVARARAPSTWQAGDYLITAVVPSGILDGEGNRKAEDGEMLQNSVILSLLLVWSPSTSQVRRSCVINRASDQQVKNMNGILRDGIVYFIYHFNERVALAINPRTCEGSMSKFRMVYHGGVGA